MNTSRRESVAVDPWMHQVHISGNSHVAVAENLQHTVPG
jgi:hypothetical protein